MHGPSNVYTRHLSHGEHSRDFTVDLDHSTGWLVRDAADARTLHEHVYDDWHRVELAITRFTVEVARLKTEGWSDA